MRSATAALLLTLLAGLVVVLALGLTTRSSLVYTLGVAPQGPIGLRPGDRACQGVIDPPEGVTFDRVGVYARGAAPAIDVTVHRGDAAGKVLAHGSVVPDPLRRAQPRLRRAAVGRVEPGGPISVCFETRGDRAVELWGTSNVASPSTSLSYNGKPADADIGVTLERAKPRSLIALTPAIARHASVFHPGWVAPAVWAVIAAIVLLGVPALLVVAVRSADDG